MAWDGTTPGKSFGLEMERLQGNHSVLGWNDSRGVILSWDGTTPEETFCVWMERLQESSSVLGWNDSGELFIFRMERLQGSQLEFQGSPSVMGSWDVLIDSSPSVLGWSHSVLGLNDSRLQGVILSTGDRTTPVQESSSVLGWNDSWSVYPSQDRRTPGESFCPGIERLQRNHSVL